MNITWDEVRELCYSTQIKEPDIVVGIARGGLIPASILSYRFNAPLYVITCSSFGRDDVLANVQISIPLDLDQALRKSRKVLLVDDIAYTGQTLFAAHRIVGACESFSLACEASSGYKPTYPGITFDSTAWIDFPWCAES